MYFLSRNLASILRDAQQLFVFPTCSFYFHTLRDWLYHIILDLQTTKSLQSPLLALFNLSEGCERSGAFVYRKSSRVNFTFIIRPL